MSQPDHVQTSHPARKMGVLPNDPAKPRVRLRALPGGVVAPPSADWLSGVRTWPMLGNDQIGDCTAAGAGHVAQAVNWYGAGLDAPVTDNDALAMYSAVSGYQPGKPATDVGATLQDALNYWRKTGVGGNRIVAFAQIDPLDLDLVRACVAIFGAVYCGMAFPDSAMTQFNAGKPWTVTARSRNEGGHCVPIGAYDPKSFTCVTWGRTQKMDVPFFQRYFDEVWVPIDLDWLAKTGKSPAGLDVAALNADFAALTGQPGPFPQPAPQPAPEPAPAPDGAVSLLAEIAADLAALLAKIKALLG